MPVVGRAVAIFLSAFVIPSTTTETTTEDVFPQWDVAAYSESEAVELASLSTAAYCQASTVSSWSCGQPCIQGVENVRISSSRSTRAFAFVGKFHGECLVAFRGSHSSEQWASNLASMEQILLPGCSYQGEGCWVGAGFLDQYLSLRDQLRDGLAAVGCWPQSTFKEGSHVTLVGHSLGGILATLAAYDLHNLGYVAGKLYTFGQAHTGNRAFAESLWDRMRGKPFYRITRKDDPFVFMPTPGEMGLDWVHAGREIYYQGGTDEGHRVCDLKVQGDPFCAYNKSKSEVSALTAICKGMPEKCSHFLYMTPRMSFNLDDTACDRSMQITFV